MSTSVWKQQWFLRKAAYYVAGIVLLGLAAFKVIDQAQVDSILAALESNILPMVGAVLNLTAGAKTNAGSDSRVTDGDVETAREAARREALADVRNVVDEAVSVATGAVRSALPTYRGPTAGPGD